MPAHGRAVDEVLALAAAVQPPRERDLGERQLGPRAVLVVEDQLDLAEVDGLARRPSRRRARRRASRRAARAGQRAGRPEDRVGDVRLAGAVRPDDDGDARLEPDLDRVHERLEAAKLDGLQVHASARLAGRADDGGRAATRPGAGRGLVALGLEPRQRLAGRVLLGVLLRRALPDAELSTVDTAAAVNRRWCGGPSASSSEYETLRPRRASVSCSSVL